MKTRLPWPVLFLSLLAAGCSTTPTRTSAGFLGEASRHASRHVGELVSTFGSVLSIRESGGSTIFRLATPNYAYAFEVSYPGEIPGLEKDLDVDMLGRISGAVEGSDVNGGKILKVDGIAVKRLGQDAVYRSDQQELVQSWLDRKLDLAEGGGAPAAPPRVAAVETAPASPAPAVRAAPDASALKALLKQWSGSSGEVKAGLRDLLERWNGLSEEDRALFLDWNGLSDEDKALFRQLVTDTGSR